MKKICVYLFLLISVVVFGQEKSLSTLKNLQFTVNEKLKINNKEREKVYKIVFEIPDRVRKEIVFPEINKGEIYIYDNLKKKIYLPVFDEYRETEIEKEENQIIQAVNKIIFLEKKDKDFRNKYLKMQEQVIFLDEATQMTIEKYEIVDGYILPQKIQIVDNLNNVEANINLEEIELNKEIPKETFILKK